MPLVVLGHGQGLMVSNADWEGIQAAVLTPYNLLSASSAWKRAILNSRSWGSLCPAL